MAGFRKTNQDHGAFGTTFRIIGGYQNAGASLLEKRFSKLSNQECMFFTKRQLKILKPSALKQKVPFKTWWAANFFIS
jgi:hypothetical protein